MKKENWIWMPHAAHFICSSKCQFHLATYVGDYIVSTVGELWQDKSNRIIHAEVHNPKWLKKNAHLKGDNFDNEYFKEFGFEEIGCGRLYETMVFKAKKSKFKCCPYEIIACEMIDNDSANKPEEAVKIHNKLCKKWGKIC